MKNKINRLFYLTGEKYPFDLAGVYFKGIQYYDLSKLQYINSSGIADLIAIIKVWTFQGNEVKFVNVSENIRKYLYEMGLEIIFFIET